MSFPDILFLYIACAVASYCVGSVNFAIIITFFIKKEDIRERGSGNAGAANVLRSVGRLPGAAVMLCDFAKGAAGALLAQALAARAGAYAEELMVIAAICTVAGHICPVFFSFRGGKGVSPLAGALLILSLRAFAAMLLFYLIILLCSRVVSTASMSSALMLPAIICLCSPPQSMLLRVCCAILCSIAVLLAHKANFIRLMKGTEPVLWR